MSERDEMVKELEEFIPGLHVGKTSMVEGQLLVMEKMHEILMEIRDIRDEIRKELHK